MNPTLQAIAEQYHIAPCRVPEFIPSGIPALDAVTGGIPKGRILDIHGSEDAGKTALALALAKGATLFLDAENSLVSAHVRAQRDFFIMHPESLEDALEICRTAARGFDTIIIDSIEALPTRHAGRMSIGGYDIGSDTKARERLLSHALPILVPVLVTSGCTLIVVNQMRNRQGVVYGKPDFSTGGKALGYYAALQLELHAVEHIKDAEGRTCGQVVWVHPAKNSFHGPCRNVYLALDYCTGKFT